MKYPYKILKIETPATIVIVGRVGRSTYSVFEYTRPDRGAQPKRTRIVGRKKAVALALSLTGLGCK